MVELARVSPDGYTAAVSVMDPFLVAWAAYHRLPCVYVDSLYWMWNWEGLSEEDMMADATAITAAASIDEAMRLMAGLEMHRSQYVAHVLCTTACVQRAPGASERADALRGHPNVRLIDSIVDLTHRSPADPDLWLVTTSGLLSPVVPIELGVSWAQSACALVDEAAQLSGCTEPMVLTGNPEVLERVSPTLPARFQPVSLNHDAILEHQNRAIACLTPPGLTTILESAGYGTPVVFLPEQHYAHFANYRLLTSDGAPARYVDTLLNTRLDRSAGGDVAVETRSLIAQLEVQRRERTEIWSAMVGALAEGMLQVRDDRARVARRQNELVSELFGGHGGAEEVYETLESVTDTVAVTR
ncbi:hypothetical protein IU500_17610 [Nocardia terpenica]|nr:hypothetical protein [Nocardia terpenica]MBF6063303.1 hypothetical protein [Nocardia terpenica]MBF6105859.1 hypothetical protein [Nocardia terpenica]MBF6113557.1 hypothetical protein [Nocardia terpenica]MBF6119600.1 hypothetical protein [Nocardia terpenica]